jgi:hypothetical protein
MPMAQQQAASVAPPGAVPGTGPALASNSLLGLPAGAVPHKPAVAIQNGAVSEDKRPTPGTQKGAVAQDKKTAAE